MFDRLISGLFGAGGAIGFAQFPAFYQQYLQRLGGHRDQALSDLRRLESDAHHLGYSVEAYLANLGALDSEVARQTALRESNRIEEAQELAKAYDYMASAPVLDRPFVFAEHLDPEIFSSTLSVFQPAIPLTPEALIYGAFGLFLALASWRLARRGIMWIKRSLRGNGKRWQT